MASIAVVGASGLIGSAVRDALAPRHSLVTIGRGDKSDLRADLAEPATVSSLDLGGIETLIHCAGVIDEDFTAGPGRPFRQATEGMAALVARARACGVARFAYISSAHVYGPLVGTLSETSPANPLSDYAIAHFASEQILRRNTGPSFHGAIFRPCAVFGIPPDLARFRRWGLIPFAFPKSLVETGKIELKSSGAPRRNFVAASDIADALLRWLEEAADAHDCMLINPLGRDTMTVWEFAGLCARAFERLGGKNPVLLRANTGDGSMEFEYVSNDRRYSGKADLALTVERLMRLIAGGLPPGQGLPT